MIAADDWALSANYVPAGQREPYTALGALDARLGEIVRTTTQPLIGQLRLTWWHEQLCALDNGSALHGEPLLARLAKLHRHGVRGNALAGLVEGWEMLLQPLPLEENALDLYAVNRGGALFTLAGRVLSETAPEGTGWALVDFATQCSDAVTRERALALARSTLPEGRIGGAKALRILLSLARSELAAPRTRWALLRAMVAA